MQGSGLPDLSGYAEAVRQAKRRAEPAAPATWKFLFAGVVLCVVAFEGDRYGLSSTLRSLAFTAGALSLLVGALLAFSHVQYLCVAQRLGYAMSTLAELTGWEWTPTHANAEGHPVTTGRMVGEAAGLSFIWETDLLKRSLRFALAAAETPDQAARDFDDLQAEAALTAWRQSPDAFPATAARLKTQAAKGFGRDRTLRVEGDVLVIECVPYLERRLAADANIARRQREVAAIAAIAEAAARDRAAALERR